MTPFLQALAYTVALALFGLGCVVGWAGIHRAERGRRGWPLALAVVALWALAFGWSAYWVSYDDASNRPCVAPDNGRETGR